MALVTDAPEDLPEADPDVLKDLVDPEAKNLKPAELKLGQATLMVLDPPPAVGEYVDIAMRLRIKRVAEDQNTVDAPITYPRYGEIVAAWPLGEEMPKPKKTQAEQDAEAEAEAAQAQPPLFDEAGIEVDFDDAPVDPDDDDGRPPFSDGAPE